MGIRADQSLLASAATKAEVVVQTSTALEDPSWDQFLEGVPEGHFQQSSIWARAKAAEGWQPFRVSFLRGGRIVGGFQVLTRETRFGQIGYISKGPALAASEGALLNLALDSIWDRMRRNRIKALILQAPDRSVIPAEVLSTRGFLLNHLFPVISATLLIDVGDPIQEIKNRMRRTTALELKRAVARGIQIREGTEADLGLFFRLMTETCKRQQTFPSPASEAALRAVWDAFRPQNKIRLNIAHYQDEPVAASICLCFGDRVTFWKKGWSGACRDKHPNQLVMFDAIQWAHDYGFRTFDCLAMNRGTAEALLAGKPLSGLQKRGRDFFLLGYGGTPVLLPDSQVCFRSSLARFVYSQLSRKPHLLSRLRRLK